MHLILLSVFEIKGNVQKLCEVSIFIVVNTVPMLEGIIVHVSHFEMYGGTCALYS